MTKMKAREDSIDHSTDNLEKSPFARDGNPPIDTDNADLLKPGESRHERLESELQLSWGIQSLLFESATRCWTDVSN